MQSVLRQLCTVNSAAKLSAVNLEQERTIVLIHPISAIINEILISLPWQ